MYILGIDPGTGRTGWGVIRIETGNDGLELLEYVAHGCIITEQTSLMYDRLHILHTSMREILDRFNPDCMAVEHIFFGRNVKTAVSVSQARGVILLAAAQHKTPLFEYTGITVKYDLSGNGRMDKKDIQVIVRRLLDKDDTKLQFNSKDKAFDDSADALAIAITHAHKHIETQRNGGVPVETKKAPRRKKVIKLEQIEETPKKTVRKRVKKNIKKKKS